MTHRAALEAALLSGVVVSCWAGSVGMLRMREPMQALHFLSLPAAGGSVLLVLAVFLETGSSQAAWKTLLICLILLAINSVVTHATARAFRTRDKGGWEPHPGDGSEFVPVERKEAAS